jgi:hypothetical protein
VVYRHVFFGAVAGIVQNDFLLLGSFRGLCSKLLVLLLKSNGKHFQDFLPGPSFSKDVNLFSENILVKPELEVPLALSALLSKV